MRRSSFELFWDRLETLLGGSARSRYTLAGAATVLFVVCGILVGNFGKAPTEMTEADKPSPTQFQAQTQPVNYEAISRSRNIQMKEVDLSVPDHGGKHIEF